MTRHRGSAMMETVLVMPILLVILSLMLLFGRQMVRMERNVMMARYEASRVTAHVSPTSTGPHANFNADSPLLNQAFFGAHADHIDSSWHTDLYPSQASPLLLSKATTWSSDTGDLAQQCLGGLPEGGRVLFATQHSSGNAYWQSFMRPIHTSFGKIDTDWRYVNGMNPFDPPTTKVPAWPEHGDWNYAYANTTPMLNAIRHLYLSDLDKQLQTMNGTGNFITPIIGNICWGNPGYRGPTAGMP